MSNATTVRSDAGYEARYRVSYGASQRLIAMALFLAGAALVYTVGFAHSSTLHNAAHDSRHALAFPCH